MPDGGAGGLDRASVAAHRIMRGRRERRAALAWLALIRPHLGLPADEGGVQWHLHLFATDDGYWLRLCVLFGVLRMGD